MGAIKFNLAPKFPKIGYFQPQIMYFGQKVIRQEENFPTG